MTWVIVILVALLLILIFKYISPYWKQYLKLNRDYQNISLLPISPIPFIGNIHQFDKRTYMFFKLLTHLSRECQEQGKGLYCVWYSIHPMIFLCSGKGLEVLGSYHLVLPFSSFIHLDIY